MKKMHTSYIKIYSDSKLSNKGVAMEFLGVKN